jgi:hypothetical protein
MTVSKKIFAQSKPESGITTELYMVPYGHQAKGTIYVSQQQGVYDLDYVSVQILPNTLQNDGVLITPEDSNTYIMSTTPLYGQVPIYLQQICLNSGDVITVTSVNGWCAFTYLGDLYTPPN